jgi:hypothetical protein
VPCSSRVIGFLLPSLYATSTPTLIRAKQSSHPFIPMAFFGLAHLGPQSTMLNLRLNSYSVSLFTLDEFKEAFIRTARTDVTPQGEEPALPLPSLKVVLDTVFHGPVPPLELTRVTAALEAGLAQRGTDTLSLSDFLLVIEGLQTQPLEVDEDNYAHYRSFNQLRAHKLRQVRPFHGPEETLRAPATMLQQIGFENKAFKPQPRFVKNHCEETKFKSEMIKVSSRPGLDWLLDPCLLSFS